MSSLQPAVACGFTMGGLGSLRTKPETYSPSATNNLQKASKCLSRNISAPRAVGRKVSTWLRILSYAPEVGFVLCPQLCWGYKKESQPWCKILQRTSARETLLHIHFSGFEVSRPFLCVAFCVLLFLCVALYACHFLFQPISMFKSNAEMV